MKKYKDDNKTKFVTPSKFYANEYNTLTGCTIKFIPHAIDKSRLQIDKSNDEICEQYNMNKKSMIKELVCEFAKAYGVGSSMFKEIYIKQDALVNKIDRRWKKIFNTNSTTRRSNTKFI